MKIYAFATVKNEEDIIESFVRYNMNIFDGMVISDNCSNDQTLFILKKLKEEGYNIDILEDKNKTFNQVEKRNELLNYTIKKYKPDFVFPLDADEFISTYKGINPREIIEKLETNKLYKLKMENYILNGKESDDLFIPNKIQNLRICKDNSAYNYKCFIPKGIMKKDMNLAMGSHTIFNKDNSKEEDSIINKDLFLAHYPVRSSEQIMIKTIMGRLNYTRLHSREEGLGFHQFEIIDEIINNGNISNETLLKISKYYSIKNHNKKIITKKKPINTSFCKNIQIKYTNVSTESNVLIETLKVSFSIINEMREELKKEREINLVIDDIDKIRKLEEEKELYRKNLEAVVYSRGWKILEKIRKIKRLGK